AAEQTAAAAKALADAAAAEKARNEAAKEVPITEGGTKPGTATPTGSNLI
ncbi:cell envelope integrity protein TolA, partial [bacterium]|nr:cell envelope integrity protein TolA [bacterium]